ncbi:breast cancer anti-estrogen resistance protein 3 homolog [Oppia nitens]|uniref:breast cancer anti-estrogen resistance protein 3 homolog n=1 Tax=Oppia nitens TaxID=1686743 RepID=UPI0023DA4AEC|nr:breast cancer anti-estrogen resistance protein 3 homolog [Oppia nitens]
MTSDYSESQLKRKLLEWELSLNLTDMRSNAWFHGSISRCKAEELLEINGQFLVRNCTSRPDEYVLSTRNGCYVLHFVISRVLINANTDYQTVGYAFEDDYFDSISNLITYYVGNKRPISLASMAVITTPVNRLHPLSDLQEYLNKQSVDMKYKSNELNCCEDMVIDGQSNRSPKHNKLDANNIITNSSSLNDIQSIIEKRFSSISLTYDNMSQCSGYSSHKNESNGSEDSAFFSENVSPKQLDNNSSNLYDYTEHSSQVSCDFSETKVSLPPLLSQIKSQTFHTYLLPKDNKPLDTTAIVKIKSVLLDTGPRVLANHLTKCDIEFIKLLEVNHWKSLGIGSAFELILLPNGQQMRLDLLERHNCMKYFICISILTTIHNESRAIVLNKWIEIAIEVKTALGNLFGFSTIMEALNTTAITALKSSWALLRTRFTNNAIIYETNLRPQFKSMTECTEPHAPNTVFPFIFTLIQIMERHCHIMNQKDFTDDSCNPLSPKQSLESLGLWFEETSADCGLQQIVNHLEFGSQFKKQLTIYRRNANIVLNSVHFEELLTDMFRTEFHRQFLFGFRGSNVNSDQKFDKFDKIIAALVTKCDNT